MPYDALPTGKVPLVLKVSRMAGLPYPSRARHERGYRRTRAGARTRAIMLGNVRALYTDVPRLCDARERARGRCGGDAGARRDVSAEVQRSADRRALDSAHDGRGNT